MLDQGATKEQGKGPKQHQGKGQGAKGQGKGAPKSRADREADRVKKLDRKIERAGQPDTAVVSRKALETNAMVALMGQNDYFIDQLRKKVGYDSKIKVEDAMLQLQINRAIRDILSIQNAAMQHTLGMTYEPSKGLDAPVVKPSALNLEKIYADLQAIITEATETVEKKDQASPAVEATKGELKKAA